MSRVKAGQKPAWQVLLLAAWRLEEEHRAQWSPGDLAVTAARIAPEAFCLRSAFGTLYSLPDNNRTIVALSHRQCGLLVRELVERVRPGVYRLTDAGRAEAAALASGEGHAQ